MNPVVSFLKGVAFGPDLDAADVPLLDFGTGNTLTRRHLTESVLGIAGIGTGKTTLARTISRAMLRDRFGGLVLCVKGSQIKEFRSLCEAEGRMGDLIELGADSGNVFNPLAGEASSAEAAALLGELAEVLSERVREGGDNDAFWRAQLSIVLRNVFTLCRLSYGRHDVRLAAELFDGRANSLAELADPTWQRANPMAAAISLARKCDHDSDARLAVDYFARAYPTHGDRLQGSLSATVASIFDHLRRSPLCEMFAGESTFRMDDLLDDGKICLIALPALDSVDGRIGNALMQFCFCRAATRKTRRHYSFLISDECQETMSRELMRKLAVLREFKVASVMLTQNVAVLDDRIGETAREAFCGLLGLKIFGHQGHDGTRQWAADTIGKRKVPVTSTSSGRGERGGKTSGTSATPQWDYRVPPSRFYELNVGETICLRAGRVWHSHWHKDMPGSGGTVGIV